MTKELIQIERELLQILSKNVNDPNTIKERLYDMIQNPKLMSTTTIKKLMNRYKKTQFFILCRINELEEEEIRKGNFSIKIPFQHFYQCLSSVLTSDNNDSDFFESNNHMLFLENLNFLIKKMAEKKLLIIFPEEESFSFRSKTAEIIRLLLNLPVRKWVKENKQYQYETSIANVKYHMQMKMVPSRTQKINDVIRELCEEAKTGFEKSGRRYKYDGLKQSTYGYNNQIIFEKAVKSVLNGFTESLASKYDLKPEEIKLSDFQVKCIKETLRSKFVHNFNYTKDLIITAGVASGKTFAFLLGALIFTYYQKYIHERIKNKKSAVRVLIIYPRVSLSQDQYDVLSNLLEYVNEKSMNTYNLGVKIETASDFGGQLTNDCASTIYDALKQKSVNKPDIWISNIETLRRRIKNPASNSLFEGFLDFIILDEIHLYGGIEGIHVSKLMSRILGRIMLKRDYQKWARPMYIGASATIAQPIEHSSKIFPNSEHGKIQHISASDSTTLDEFGVFHHILVNARKGRSLVGTLTDLTSCSSHNIFENLSSINEQISNTTQTEINKKAAKLPKIVGFSDSLSVVTRWNDLVRDQEKSYWRGFWNPGELPKVQSRDFPFYGMFYKPLIWRFNLLNNQNKRFSTKEFQKINDRLVLFCKRCKSLKRDRIDLSEYLSNKNFDYFIQKILIPYNFQEKIDPTIENLDRCPFFQRGMCWLFTEDSASYFEKYPVENGSYVECYGDNIRTRISTSRVRECVQNPSKEFANDFKHVFGRESIKGQKVDFKGKILVPFVVSSPVLEVGVDINNVVGTILHKAIRNLSSYKQKIGRSGREIFSHSYGITLVSLDPRERYYYRNSYMLADPNILDPIPLKRTNVDVERAHALEACFDYFAGLEWDIYNIPKKRREFDKNKKSFNERVKELVKSDYLKIDKNPSLINYIMKSVGINKDVAEIAIRKFAQYLRIFSDNTISKHIDEEQENLAELWEKIIAKTCSPAPKQIQINRESLLKLNDLVEKLNETISKVEDEKSKKILIDKMQSLEVEK